MPSPRAQRARRETRSEAVVEHSSPSRPSKRRKKNDDVTEAPDAAVEPADEGDSSHVADQSTTPLTDEELITKVSRSLHASAQPNQLVQASRDHSNLLHENNNEGVQAYAKLAASDWTYFIRQLKVNIGRCPDPPAAPAPAPAPADSQGSSAPPVADDNAVHVDLGPSKMISRLHAVIYFDGDQEAWRLTVKGRNALKVDGIPWRNGQSGVLKSGEVIEIGGVEMMFVLPVELSPLAIHKQYLERAGIGKPEPAGAPVRPVRHPLPSGDGLHSSSPNKSSRGHGAQKTLAPAPPDYKRPGTPPSIRRVGLGVKGPNVDSTPGPILMTNSDVDLSLDENAHIKPQYSYAQLITQAIISTPDHKCTLAGIYHFITTKYAYYRHQPAGGWQNSIRHNLSLHKAFEKVARHSDEPGKGMKWQLVAENREEMIKQTWRVGRGGHRGASSNPSSPSSAQLNYITSGPRDMAAARDPVSSARKRKVSPSGSPQPRTVLRTTEAAAHSTPVRATRKPLPDEPGKDLDGSPLPRAARKPAASSALGMVENAPGSPTLTSSYDANEDHLSQFVTPAPPRVHPRLAPPSTAQRPSQHMPTSSPAPFWRYADFGSTPLKAPAGFEVGSPTKGGPVGGLGGDVKGEQQVASSPPPVVQSRRERSKSPVGGVPPQSPTRRGGSVGAVVAPGGLEDEEGEVGGGMPEEEGFDLTKGFQSISSFHATVVKPGSNGESQSQSQGTNANGDPETQESV
ncbi:transcription factor [Podospora pseudopauciseta]|uniref:Transcription factor n=1 Tax=Podospora pseudopauciseta TaxID=2093780 RepID=A0ABR0H0M2_9PEZI|nr:transcription factor [Podospora pseudopauciseta]